MITRRPRGDHELARFEVLPALWKIAPPASTQCRFCARQRHVLMLRSVSASVVWAMHRWLRGPMRVRSVPRSRTNCMVLRFLLYLLQARRWIHHLLQLHGIWQRSLWTYGPSQGT